MPVRVRLIDGLEREPLEVSYNGEQEFVIKSRHDYAKVGFAAARWARAALRGAQLGEGGSNAELRMEIDFLGDEELEPAAKPAKKARKRKAKANGAAE
jgi:hypothetical protein